MYSFITQPRGTWQKWRVRSDVLPKVTLLKTTCCTCAHWQKFCSAVHAPRRTLHRRRDLLERSRLAMMVTDRNENFNFVATCLQICSWDSSDHMQSRRVAGPWSCSARKNTMNIHLNCFERRSAMGSWCRRVWTDDSAYLQWFDRIGLNQKAVESHHDSSDCASCHE